jgi:hypothetical protein
MFSAVADLTRSSRSSQGSASASPTLARIASIVPLETLEPNSCSHNSTTSRREIRLRTESTAIAA